MSYGQRHTTTPPPRARPHSPSASIRDRSDLFHAARGKGPVQLMQPPSLGAQGLQIANQMLNELAGMLKCKLAFDNQHTTVIDYGGKATVLITYDPPTERIYVYSTLLSALPKDPDAKLALYEFLLEGCLLGRDMAGGGVGISLKDEFCLMTTSFDLRNSEADALRSVVPVFVSSLLEWRKRVQVHPSMVQARDQVQQDLMSAPTGMPGNPPMNSAPPPQHQQPQPPPQPHDMQMTPQPPSPSQASATGNMRSKALLVGIDYRATAAPLSGCCNDARTVEEFLKRNGFDDPSNMLVLTDDNPDPNFHPTKQNILYGLKWLVDGVTPSDSLFFLFSGIARQEQDLECNDDGSPNFYTSICPSDFQKFGTISEDEIYETAIAPLPADCAFNAILDCCNALFDLGMPLVYVADPVMYGNPDPQMIEAAKGRRQAIRADRANTQAGICVLAGTYDKATMQQRIGAHFTDMFTVALTKQPAQSCHKLIHSIQSMLAPGGNYTYKCYPCLYSTKEMPLLELYTL
eukprot:TRINITY_DN66840_c6_g1_i1.p1 TRINITY_DN66840_c6_g1~~TRINITY_DN66840_c6_g1_i1.p1  ORF type:complete len:518 (+),score=61.04 TRINITY_DN66840_c6_g1_i1:48-1601(+)